MSLSEALLKKAPKVNLHDHLDGGLRIGTVIDLAKAENVKLPTEDPKGLEEWFHRGADRGDLGLYLETFGLMYDILQSEAAFERVAYEMMEDVRRDGVVYVETRFAPVYHTRKGLNYEEIVSSALKGLQRGREDFGVGYGLIICSMRDMDLSMEMAELAVDFRDRGVVGVDLAGDEYGHPPKRHLDAFHYIQRHNFNITIHAGEAFGKESIWQALQYCGAHRIGHGTRLKDDFVMEDGKIVGMGSLAQYILDKRIPLECCLSSNVHVGAAKSLAAHPFQLFYRKNFRVTLNTDNRLMSATSMSRELALAAKEYDLDMGDIEKLTLNAMKSAFIHYDERCNFIYEIIKPGFAHLRKGTSG